MENKRLESLDAFRGLDMMFLMGLSSVIVCICGLFPGGENCFLVEQMEHATWDGLTLMDLVFPTFLFIAGISFPFSLAKQQSLGASGAKIHLKVLRRAILLFLCGLLYNGILTTSSLADFRYCSVLGRIGFAWMFASLIFMHCKTMARCIVAGALLLGYFLLIKFVPAPDAAGADSLSQAGNIAGWIDRMIMPGRLYRGNWDPEGILGVVPATVTALLGMLTGDFVRRGKMDGSRKSLCMLGAALGLVLLGLLWSLWMPLNKNLWSSSFTLVAGGIALAGFTIFYYIIDVKGHSGPLTFIFKMFGMNSITIYLASAFVPFYTMAQNVFGGVAALLPPAWGTLLLTAGVLAIQWLLLYFLYRKKVFLKV